MKKIFIDGGANIGNSIELFLKKYPNAREFEIHSFEAHPTNFSKLKKYKDKVKIYNKALFKEDSILDFYEGSKLSHSIRKDKITGGLNLNKPIKVQAIRLASFIKNNFSKTDYIVLKLDVEGAEYDIIPDLIQEGLFDGWIDILFGEWHVNKLKELPQTQHDKLVEDLAKKGFKMREWSAVSRLIEL